MAKQTIERVRVGKGFHYYDDGKQVANKEELAYFKSLGIPPAWKEVRISKSRSAKIQATGLDKAGRLQYIYHPVFRARQERAKFERILRFAQALPRMRRITNEHLNHPQLDQQKVLACIVRLMDQAYFRVGNEVYARDNESYGLTTIRSRHTQVKGDTIIFDFVGKSGQKHRKEITDKRLAKIVKKLDELPGFEVFKYYDQSGQLHDVKSDDVNEYIKRIMGEEFSAKDFRTWGGTLLAAGQLAQIERDRSLRERKKAVTQCVRMVAQKLGNTPAIARASYIDPRVIRAYVDNDDLAKVRRTVQSMDRKSYLSADEHCVLHLLEKARQ
jgi:DNA topoisomerase I